MASLYPNTTTEGYEQFRNDSMNDSVSDNSNMTSSQIDIRMIRLIVFTVVGGPLCVVGFVANIICYNVLRMDSRKKHRAATFMLQALAVADNFYLTISFYNLSILFGLLPMLGARERIISKILLAHSTVYVVPFANMAITASVWITVLIAINRYIAVCRPLDAHRLASLKRTKIQVAVVVILAIIFCLPLFFQLTLVYPEDSDFMSMLSVRYTIIGPGTLIGMVYYICLYSIILMVFPLILLIILNIKIIWELRKVEKWADAVRQNGSQSENNITLMMVVIILVFIVCNTSTAIYSVAYGSYSSSGQHVFWCVSELLLVTNSSTNFLVYYVIRKSFRRAFHKAIRCCQPRALIRPIFRLVNQAESV